MRRVTATDWAAEAVASTRSNAARNAVTVRAIVADWRDPGFLASLGPFDLVVAADVLYEQRHAEPLLSLLRTLAAPRVLLADPSRTTAAAFLDAVSQDHTVASSRDALRPAVMLHELSPSRQRG